VLAKRAPSSTEVCPVTRAEIETAGSRLALLCWLTLLAIAYESLIPFQYRPVSLNDAIANFLHLRWEPLGPGDRGDWIGNIVLYLPLGFFLSGALGRRSRVVGFLFAAALGTVIAVGLEFAQTWASPRTVRLNDVVAEAIGAALGAGAWVFCGPALVRAVREALRGGRTGLRAALLLYLVAYTFVALYPFDFAVNAAELRQRLQGAEVLGALPHDLFSVRALVHLLLKAALMIPLGVAIRIGWRGGALTAAVAAALFTSAIECARWFELSAQVNAANVLLGAVGAVIGNRVAVLEWLSGERGLVLIRACAWILLGPYVLVLATARGWRPHVQDSATVNGVLQNLHWIPFYYTYYASKLAAFGSLMNVAASFVPVGTFMWAVRLRNADTAGHQRQVWQTALIAGLVAVCIEFGGLVTAGLRPDPTNVLIAIAAAVIAQRGCEWFARILLSVAGAESAA